MEYQEVEEESLNLVTEYYKNNLSIFFKNLADDVIWMGPLQGQVFKGRCNIKKLWNEESEHGLTFSLSDIRSNIVKTSRSSCDTILRFHLYTSYPSGIISMDYTRIQMTWKDVPIEMDDGSTVIRPRIVFMHVSNAAPRSESDIIYPVHNEDVAYNVSFTGDRPIDSGERVYVRCKNHSYMYLISNHILWIESADNSNHAVVHTLDGKVETIHPLKRFALKYPDIFIRAHSSFLINPLHVKELQRFTLTMSDGMEIPIPEKKYTWFKKELNNRLSNL